MDKRFEQIPVSEKLDGVIDHCMEQLHKEQKSKRKNRVKKTFISLGTAAAVFVCAVFFGASNPNAAESIPLIGHITRLMQGEQKPAQEYIPIDQRIPASTRKDIKIPKEFDFTWNISIIYDWPYDLWEYALNEEKPYHTSFLPNNGFGGTWDFQFSIPLNVNQ